MQGVVINVCLCGEAAKLMGIENHVCEVQIVLDTFADLLQVTYCSADAH